MNTSGQDRALFLGLPGVGTVKPREFRLPPLAFLPIPVVNGDGPK